MPTSAPAPNFGSSTATAPGASSGASSDTPSGQGPKYSDKAGRFGIRTDTTLGGVGGLSARFQVAKNFGIQAIVSFTRIGLDAKEDNSDLTNYVSTVLVGPAVRGDIGLAFTNKVNLETIIGGPSGVSGFHYYFSGSSSAPPPAGPRTNQAPAGTRLPEVTRNTEGEYVVFDPNSGERVTIKDRNLADTIARGVRNGVPLRDAVTEAMTNRSVATTPAPRRMGNAQAARLFLRQYIVVDGKPVVSVYNRKTGERELFQTQAEARGFEEALRTGTSWSDAAAQVAAARRNAPDANIGDTIASNVPNQFRAPYTRHRRDGEIDDYYVEDPANSRSMRFNNPIAAEAALKALNDGVPWDQAVRQGYAAAANAPVTTPDGLASANSGGVTTPSSPAPPGSAPAPIVGSERPAIIVTPEQPRYADKSGASGIGGNRTLSGTTPPGTRSGTTTGTATANSGGVTTPVVPRPARPAGESVSFLEEALVQGSTYRIEIVRTPDGRTLAVGTGDQAGHVFGEAKEGGFGWRNEGPWTPPPAPAPIVSNERPAIIVAPDSVPSSPPATLREAVEQANASATSTASTSTVSIAPLSHQRAANMRIRLQIAGSDREQMTATANAAIDSPNSFVATGR